MQTSVEWNGIRCLFIGNWYIDQSLSSISFCWTDTFHNVAIECVAPQTIQAPAIDYDLGYWNDNLYADFWHIY